MTEFSLGRRCVAEAAGTALLLAMIVGSGIMAERLSGGNVAIALLANSLATGAGLMALILSFGPISGGHFNPLVTLAAVGSGDFPVRDATGYLTSQLVGAVLGVLVAHLMFREAAFTISQQERSGAALAFSEAVAAFGLLTVILGSARLGVPSAGIAIGAYIAAAYWFTSSTSFANPVVTIARALTDSFTGIRPADVPGFIGAQFGGAFVAVVVFRWLFAPAGRSRA
jgi:glycerol uptake facilitator-like aquaporin